ERLLGALVQDAVPSESQLWRRHAEIPPTHLGDCHVQADTAMDDAVVVSGGDADVTFDRKKRVRWNFAVDGGFKGFGANVVQVEIQAFCVGKNNERDWQCSTWQWFGRGCDAGGNDEGSKEENHLKHPRQSSKSTSSPSSQREFPRAGAR